MPEKRIYVLMVPGWEEGEETSAKRAYTDEAKAEAAAKGHFRRCAYITEVTLEEGEVNLENMRVKANCSRCGTSLKEISYAEPDWSGYSMQHPEEQRPPLCEPCWKKADQDARAVYERAETEGPR